MTQPTSSPSLACSAAGGAMPSTGCLWLGCGSQGQAGPTFWPHSLARSGGLWGAQPRTPCCSFRLRCSGPRDGRGPRALSAPLSRALPTPGPLFRFPAGFAPSVLLRALALEAIMRLVTQTRLPCVEMAGSCAQAASGPLPSLHHSAGS